MLTKTTLHWKYLVALKKFWLSLSRKCLLAALSSSRSLVFGHFVCSSVFVKIVIKHKLWWHNNGFTKKENYNVLWQLFIKNLNCDKTQKLKNCQWPMRRHIYLQHFLSTHVKGVEGGCREGSGEEARTHREPRVGGEGVPRVTKGVWRPTAVEIGVGV